MKVSLLTFTLLGSLLRASGIPVPVGGDNPAAPGKPLKAWSGPLPESIKAPLTPDQRTALEAEKPKNVHKYEDGTVAEVGEIKLYRTNSDPNI
ncbi:hypothetical protein BDQ17DRAFT_1539825, partial [Cyathus striatus]